MGANEIMLSWNLGLGDLAGANIDPRRLEVRRGAANAYFLFNLTLIFLKS
jgi:hypothetical protein